MQLSDRIKKIRKGVEFSQLTFSSVLGVSRSHISNIETGAVKPSEQLIKLICAKFEINENWLRTGEGNSYDSDFPEYVKTQEETSHRLDMLYDKFTGLFDYYRGQLVSVKNNAFAEQREGYTIEFPLSYSHPKYKKLLNAYESCMDSIAPLEKELKHLFDTIEKTPK